MLRTTSLSLVCLFAIALPARPADAQQQQQVIINSSSPDGAPMRMLQPGQQAKTGKGLLRGRVLAGDTGSPVRRAQVRISGPDIGTKTALTDAEGRYEFKDLPAGRFNMSASKSGYVTMSFGQNRPFEPGKPIDLAEAQVLEKTDVALPRGSVLAGRILDEFGEPVADANVTAMRMQYTGGKRRLTPSGRNSQSNDLGQFRIYGLPPGEYYVSATLRSMDSMVMDMLGTAGPGGPVGSNQNAGYAATYYPGTTNPAEAQRINVAVGQELQSVDIPLQPVHLARITGSIIGSDGKPMSGAMVMLLSSNKDAMQFMPSTARTDNKGQFTLSGVAPGEYSLQAQSLTVMMGAATEALAVFSTSTRSSDGAASPATPPERDIAAANVTVTGDDITGMIVVATHGAKASGKLTFEGGNAPDGVASTRVMAAPTDDTGPALASFGASKVNANGTFEIDGLVGGQTFRLMNPPKGWSIKSVTNAGGEDVTDKGIDFKPGEDVADITIVLTNKTTTLTGAVTDEKGDAQKDYTVVVFAEDQAKWTISGSRWARSARPDQQGQFRIPGLPPGKYYAIAVDYVANGEWADPDWLASASKKAITFSLDAGDTKNLDLKLSTGVGGM